jgi:phage terminase large subunit
MVIKIAPTPKQDAAWQKWLDSFTRFILFGGGAGGGKSWWICEKRLYEAYVYPGHRAFIGRKELKRLMLSTFVTWNKVCQFHHVPKEDWWLDGKYNVIHFKNGSTIDLLDMDFQPGDPLYERFGSLEYTSGDIEEAGEIQFLAFDVIKGRVGRHMNAEFGLLPKIGLTANPSKNFLYRLFYKPWKSGTLPDQYAFIRSLYGDNPHTKVIYGAQLNELEDRIMRARLRDGIWEYESDGSLMDYDAITDLFSNPIIEATDKYLIVDAARFGGDRIVFTFWRGLHCYKTVIKTMQGTDKTEEDIRNFAITDGIPYSHILVDEDGIGGGIVDHLKGIKGFVANSRPFPDPDKQPEHGEEPKPDNFDNLKAQCAYKLADRVNTHQITVTNSNETEKEMLIQELEQIKSKDADKDGKRKIQPKDEVKKNIGRSPDYGDCLLMRMFFEIQKPKTIIVPRPTTGLVKPYPGMVA